MHADRLEVEDPVEQAHVPVGRAARADVGERAGVLPCQQPRADRGHGPGSHVGEEAGVEDRPGSPGTGIEQRQQPHLAWQAELVVGDEVADDLDSGRVDLAADPSA